eukprot:Plantae.Rhodophyta-Rhodochaete_pulchella.ctg8566.p2 GENE.Plantae.Rhodophyta-Rhodochaete_pulchella.ctg8566~~Plantae.Rhodophyta-Rhodochaete_pulchella.ctg8566.p2  ORF type:complete len:219 (+),score=26.77 Plantae.Rhodophyta-Rhodochaete_pulchella.ctg8566:540-1196(+)
MVYGDAVVSVDEASQALLADQVPGMDSTILKTKARRLYDIANILAALNLVEKTVTSDRRPAFRWVGPNAGTFKTAAQPLQTRFSSATTDDLSRKRIATGRRRKAQPLIERKPAVKRTKAVDIENRVRMRQWKDYCEQWCEALSYVTPKKDISSVTLEQYPLAWLDAFDIDEYMQKAKKAGVEYERAADAWKEEIQLWKSVPENYYPPWGASSTQYSGQ